MPLTLQTSAFEQPRFQEVFSKKLVGMHVTTSITHNKTGVLWQSFMPRRAEISGLNACLYSLQVYPAGYFLHFDPETEFEKWALVEVEGDAILPQGMDEFNLPGGLYAVFNYKGSSADTRIFNYIFSEWLPASSYVLDERPHFELLGEKYKNNDPASEEEIWIPVKPGM
ncbi:GyrI-like domain-containing protein [Mucilaginibacter sp. UR6-1]|uniref:GyrI-like domain-containing protein n=1 Tax=Mucilaginibacter sp. UR6-1 TaxID=1435643 RepID=UPI001E2A1989|nr:GyrI-like domain-containing protein [Mucilaginibacter sp. UR6-1]MCC8409672.1 GyrI-like domain-containing protein [Mucilaginibacter sp. UR6-1]